MKVAITVWEDRISPVLDSSHTLLIANIKNSKIMSREYVAFNPEMPSRLPRVLSDLDIEVLICGAVSQLPADMIESGGIKLIPFITGNVDEVLASFAKSATVVPSYLMPGCGDKHRKKHKKRKKQVSRPVEANHVSKKRDTKVKKGRKSGRSS